MEKLKESKAQRAARIAETGNNALWRTRVVIDRKKYSRKLKHKKSLADARDFAFYSNAHRRNSSSFCQNVIGFVSTGLGSSCSATGASTFSGS